MRTNFTKNLVTSFLAAAMLFVAAQAQAVCSLTTGTLVLEKPRLGDSGATWAGCIQRNLDSISSNTALSGPGSVVIFFRIYVNTISALGTEIVFSSNVYMAENFHLVGTLTLPNNSIVEAFIDGGAITTLKLGDGAVTSAKLDANAVATAAIQDSAVATAKLAADSVITIKILDLNVTEAKLAAGAVTTSKVGNGAITSSKIGQDAVTTAAIINGAVTTPKLGIDSVTTTKIINDAVTAEKVEFDYAGSASEGGPATTALALNADSAACTNQFVTDTDADGTLTCASVSEATIGAGVVTTDKLASGAVTTPKLAADSVTREKIAADGCTDGQILKVNGGGAWICAADSAGTGGHTISVATGTQTSLETFTSRTNLTFHSTFFTLIDDSAMDSTFVRPGVGQTVQSTMTVACATYASNDPIPTDNTKPQQSTEGDEAFSVSITPTDGNNKLRFHVIIHGSQTTNVHRTVAIFRDAGEDAIAAVMQNNATNAWVNPYIIRDEVGAVSIAETTFKVFHGPQTSGTTYINRTNSLDNLLGGLVCSSILVEEIQQ